MKMMNKTSLALAVAAALGVMSPQTFAIVKIMSDADTKALAPELGATVGGAVLFAAEQSGESSLPLMSYYTVADTYFDGDLTASIPVPNSYTVDSTKTLSVKITLTGGAKFVNEPSLVCLNSGYASGAAAGLVDTTETSVNIAGASGLIIEPKSGGLTASVTGKATATFNVSPGLTTNGSGFCLLTFTPPATVTGVTAYSIGARGEVGISVETTYIQANQSLKTTTGGVLLKFVTALKSVIGPSTQDAAPTTQLGFPTVSIDVKQASKKFEENSDVAGVATTTTDAPLGSVYVTSAANALDTIRLSNKLAAGMTAGLIMTTGTLTISGPLMAGLQEVNLLPGSTDACAGAASKTLKGTPTTTTGGGGGVTIAGIPIADLVGGLNMCAKVDGSKVLNAGQLTAVLTGGGVANIVPDLGAEANIVLVNINGARLRVLNIPAANAPELAFIRFYNTSSQDVEVTGTLYGMDGKIIGTENSVLFTALKANDVEVLKAADLQTKVGATAPWTGRAWLMIQAQIDKESFRVQALMRTPGVGGTLINMSTDVTN